MKTDMASTSLDAFRFMGPHLGAQESRIVAFLANRCDRDWTRSELAEATGIRLSAICGRCNTLVAQQILAELPRRLCRCTGHAAHPVRLNPTQLDLGLA